jgi:hypothetical protein
MSPNEPKIVIAKAIATAKADKFNGYTNLEVELITRKYEMEIERLKIKVNDIVLESRNQSFKIFMDKYLDMIKEQEKDKAENEELMKQINDLKKQNYEMKLEQESKTKYYENNIYYYGTIKC